MNLRKNINRVVKFSSIQYFDIIAPKNSDCAIVSCNSSSKMFFSCDCISNRFKVAESLVTPTSSNIIVGTVFNLQMANTRTEIIANNDSIFSHYC